MASDIERKVAREAMRKAYDLLGRPGSDYEKLNLAAEARGHLLWAIGVFGSVDDREFVKRANEELDARIAAWRNTDSGDGEHE